MTHEILITFPCKELRSRFAVDVEKADRTGRCVFDVPAVRNIDWRMLDVLIE
jgi:hypothetical protein